METKKIVGTFTLALLLTFGGAYVGNQNGKAARVAAQHEAASLRLERAQIELMSYSNLLVAVVGQRNRYSNTLVEVSAGFGAQRAEVLEYAFGAIPDGLRATVRKMPPPPGNNVTSPPVELLSTGKTNATNTVKKP